MKRPTATTRGTFSNKRCLAEAVAASNTLPRMVGDTRDFDAGRAALRVALAVSIAAHIGMLFVARRGPERDPHDGQASAAAVAPTLSNEWAGTTSEMPGGEKLYDVSLSGGSPAPAAPASDAQSAAAKTESPAEKSQAAPPPLEKQAASKPKSESPAPSEPAPKKAKTQPDPYAEETHKEKSAPKSTPKSTAAKASPVDEPKPSPTADTDDLFAQAQRELDLSTPHPSPSIAPAAASVGLPKPVAAKTPARPAASSAADADDPSTPAAPSSASSARSAGAGAAEAGGGGSFGAVGRMGVRNLGHAFTQAIPPSCDSDSVWGTLPVGNVGSIKIAIDVEENGHIGGWKSLDEDPPKALQSLARRTVASLRAGTFALRSGAVTGGRQTLQISAIASDVEPPDGKTIKLAQDWTGDVGKAAFTQPSGRHIEVKIKVIRVEVFGAPASP